MIMDEKQLEALWATLESLQGSTGLPAAVLLLKMLEDSKNNNQPSTH
jgi:hypothetical protein